jgi:hypothetical protein
MAKLMMICFAIALLVGSEATAAVEEREEKTLTESIEGKSLEKTAFQRIQAYGHECDQVMGLVLHGGNEMTATCLDGKVRTYYRIVVSKERQRYSVRPTTQPEEDSLESVAAELIRGEGFRCPAVSDVVLWSENLKDPDLEGVAKVTCTEGEFNAEYRWLQFKDGNYALSPW